MDDISQSTWRETAEANISPPPRGLPASANPVAVPTTIRFMMAAIKRFWNRANASVTTTGTGAAYVLTYDTQPSTYVKGESFRFWVHTTNAAAATLNVNQLGARALLGSDGTALPAGDLAAGQVYTSTFDGSGFRVSVPLTKAQLDAGLAGAKTYTDAGDTGTLTAAKTYADAGTATALAAAKAHSDAADALTKTYTDTGDAAAKAYADGLTGGLLKRAGDRMTGSLSSAVVDHGTKSASATETYDFSAGNTHRVTVSGGTHTINPTNLAEGDVLQLNILYTSGALAVSGTTQFELGGGDKGTTLSAVGVTLVSGRAYRMVFEVVGGIRTAFFT